MSEAFGVIPSPEHRPLPPLPEYTCGQCGETFGSNCDAGDIACAYCGATRCPHCEKWFGGDD